MIAAPPTEDPPVASDVKYPRWLPRPLRPAPAALRQARAFTRGAMGGGLERALKIPGWLHPDQAAAICYAAHLCPDGPVIEIGSFKGKSTVFLARGMKESNRLHAIDPHEGTCIGSRRDRARAKQGESGRSWEKFHRVLEEWGLHDRVRVIRSRSHDARAGWSDPVAMVWIDGDHTYDGVRQDIEDWAPLVVPGGYIAFHDTKPDYPSDPPGSVRAAIEDSMLPSEGDFKTFLELRNAWILRRTSPSTTPCPSPSPF